MGLLATGIYSIFLQFYVLWMAGWFVWNMITKCQLAASTQDIIQATDCNWLLRCAVVIPRFTHVKMLPVIVLPAGYRYRKSRTFHLGLIFRYSRRWGKSIEIKRFWYVYFSNDIEENCPWIVKIKWVKTFGWADQWNLIAATFSHFTVCLMLGQAGPGHRFMGCKCITTKLQLPCNQG